MSPDNVKTSVHGDVVLIELAEHITADCAVLPVATERMEQGSRKFLLDLHRVRHIDSAGLARILWTFLKVQQQKGHLKLLAVPDRVRTLLAVSKLGPVFELFDSADEALRSFGPPQDPDAR